jgi:hypothetical protein
MVKIWVGVTDNKWFDFLSRVPAIDEVNFWQPSGQANFRAVEPGSLFVFKLKAPRNVIGGLLLNGKSHRAAVQVPAPSVMLDDGSVERRVRLVRPLERPSIAVDALAATAWRPTEPEAFTLAWEAELAQLPEFRESTLHVVTGLLLPIWRQLPHDGDRVYRLQTDRACPGAGQGPASGGSA